MPSCMALLGMLADMQCHYFPGYCSTRDLNLNASCSIWPLNDVDTVPKNGHYYNGNLAPPFLDQYLAYKEKFKQTMLQHEAIFKDQIHELHRLYKRQKELMDEMKRIKCHGRHLQLEPSQSNQIFSGTSFEYSQQMCKVSALPWLKPACSPSSVLQAENNLLQLNFFEGKIIQQAGCSTVQTEGCRKESELLESKLKKIGKKILDLELPAYEYIDSDPEESIAWETIPPEMPNYRVKSIVENVQRNNVEMCHGIEDKNVDFQNVTQASFSMKTICLADLNEPVKLEEETDPVSNDFMSLVSDHRKKPCHDLSVERKSDFQLLSKETIQDTKIVEDQEICLNVLHQEKNESEQECLSNNDEAGQSSSNLNSLPERMGIVTLSTSAEDAEIEQAHKSSTPHLISQSKRKFSGLDSCNRASSELIPLDDVMNCDSSLVSSSRNTRDIVRSPIAVQALPCFNSSVCLSRSSKFRSTQITGDNEPCPDINAECKEKFQSPGPQSSFWNGDNEFSSESNGTKKHIKDSVDLNLTNDLGLNSVSPSCSSVVAAPSIWLTNGEEKREESTWGSPLHRATPAVSEPGKKLILDCNSVPDSGEQFTANELVFGNRLEQKSSGLGFQVDLNSCINEDKSLVLPSLSSEVDLQAPASPENKESSPPRGESDEIQLETTCSLSEQENSDLLEDLVAVAAKAIVSISSSEAQNNMENATFGPSKAVESVSLYWFAKLASCAVDDPESEFGVVLSCKNPDHDGGYLSDGIDYFESMTLKLKETKEEEYSFKVNAQMEEVVCPVSLLSQSRRGRTRRGRQQRKDFQSEILPSLASLSRCEVTEDLQVIGGLIEAARRSTGAKTGRNGWTMGRRRRSCISSSQAETSLCTLLKQQSRHSEWSIEDWNLVGWGKKTRRRRGQRCPASKPRLILGQV